MNVVITVKYILFCFRLGGFLKLSDYKTVSSSNGGEEAIKLRKLKFLEHAFPHILWKGMISIFAIGTFTLILNLFLFSDLWAEVFTTTAYCSCEKCCDKDPSDEWYGITATGTKAKWGTVAVDRKVIKLGHKLRIDGFPNTTFRAEDVGGAIKGNHLDIWFPSHEEALEFGVQKKVVYFIE